MNVKGHELLLFNKEWPMGADWFPAERRNEDLDLNGVFPNVWGHHEYDLEDSLGAIRWSGRGGPRPSSILYLGQEVQVGEDECLDICRVFELWQQTQDVKIVVRVAMLQADYEGFKQAMDKQGWKVEGWYKDE